MTDTEVHYHVEDGVGRPAINVKDHNGGDAYRFALGRLIGADSLDDMLAPRSPMLDEIAYDRIVSDFWQAATEIAEQRGLGEITQEGRSGGWLVFTSFDPQPHRIDPKHTSSESAAEGREWLAGYRSMVEWADAWIADAPRKVAALAQQYAMDEAGEDAALRFFAFDAGFPHRYMASVARGNAIMAGYEEGAPA